MKITPLNDRIVLEPVEEETKSAAGIVIPETAQKDAPQKGKVIAVGPGNFIEGERKAPDVKIGDTVLFTMYGPVQVKVGGKEILIAKEHDVLAVIEEDKK